MKALFDKKIQNNRLGHKDRVKATMKNTYFYTFTRNVQLDYFQQTGNKSIKSIKSAVICCGHEGSHVIICASFFEFPDSIIVLAIVILANHIIKSLSMDVDNRDEDC